ncbi:hypothetical protein MKW94_024794 [Papaver nudicaule]|uniref:Uncharacterized protein n=1 Tax=Papaver nudicaule TaxID=74823 RepID=A0AA42AY54_PAPNU|nr:hypothetical protein [Papaver nudicaule]
MELFTAAKDLEYLDAHQIISEAVKILAKSFQQKLFWITLTFTLPLSLIQLISGRNYSSLLIIRSFSTHEFYYVLSLFLFSLLSTSAVVFTVASLYASKPVSFIPTLFAIPRVFEHLMMTFFYILLLMIVNFLAFCGIPAAVLFWLNIDDEALIFGFLGIFLIMYIPVHFHVIVSWNLASVISVVEPNVYGLAAMKKSKQLLQGRTRIALHLAGLYFSATWFVEHHVFQPVMQFQVHLLVKLLLGLVCLFMLVAVNLTGLLVQCVFFLACKNHHNQVVDKKVLYDYLGG